MYGSVAEQGLVGVAGGRLDGKQHQSRRVTVDAVDGDEGVDAEFAFQPHQHGLLQVLARRRDRQKVRFVDDDEVVVLVQDHFVERNAGFNFQVAVVVDTDVALVGTLWGDGYAKFILHIAIGHALQPRAAGDGGEALSQEVGDGAPWGGVVICILFRQAHDAGADAVFGR